MKATPSVDLLRSRFESLQAGMHETDKGLRFQAALDMSDYSTGVKVSDEAIMLLSIKRDKFRGEWNYSILSKTA